MRSIGIVVVNIAVLAIAAILIFVTRSDRKGSSPESAGATTGMTAEPEFEDGPLDPFSLNLAPSTNAVYAEKKKQIRELLQQQRIDQARSALEELQAEQASVLGKTNAETLISTIELATLNLHSGRAPEAVKTLEECVLLIRDLPGFDENLSFAAHVNLAMAYQACGEPTRAIETLEPPLVGKSATLGANHREVLQARNLLAGFYWDAGGQGQKAIDIMQDIVEKLQSESQEKPRQEPDMQLVMASDKLASMLAQSSQPAAAQPHWERALQGFSKALGPAHPRTQRIRKQLGTAYSLTGNNDRTVALFEENVESLAEKLGTQHEDTVRARMALINTCRRIANYDRALEEQQKILAAMQAKHPPNHRMVFFSRGFVADLHLDAGHWVQAEPILLELHEQIKAAFFDVPAEQLEEWRIGSLERLVRLYDGWNKPDQKARWQQELEASISPKPDSEKPSSKSETPSPGSETPPAASQTPPA